MIEKLYLPQSLILAGESLLSEQDLYLFNEGSHYRLYRKLGAHPCTRNGVTGTHFAVWRRRRSNSPSSAISTAGHRAGIDCILRGCSGVWSGFFPGISPGTAYKYHIVSRYNGYQVDKCDPFGFFHEVPPRTASIVWDSRLSLARSGLDGSSADSTTA